MAASDYRFCFCPGAFEPREFEIKTSGPATRLLSSSPTHQMSTVLFAWELGGGLGHVRPQLALARALAARGHAPIFALRVPADAAAPVLEAGFPVLQAPIRLGPPPLPVEPSDFRSFSDILALSGWGLPDDLEPLLRSWDGLLDRIRPGLAVADHAPALTLAARGSVPVVQLGTGFCAPPAHLPEFPPLVPEGRNLLAPGILLESIAEVQRRRCRPAPPTVPAIFDAGPILPTCLRAFDPYDSVRATRAIGPLDPLPSPSPAPAAHRWFAYLGADDEASVPALTSLAATGLPGTAVLRGSSRTQRERLRRLGLHLSDTPLPPAQIFREFSVVVHRGGLGLTTGAFAAGRPQIVLPRWLEQRLTAARLEAEGVAIQVKEAEDVGKALGSLVADTRYPEAARAASVRLQGEEGRAGLEAALEACLRLLPGGGGA